MSEINTAINRVNQIYESDLGVHLNLVASNSSIIEVSPADFDLSNDDGSALLSENQTLVDTNIGSTHYDIGHVFSTGGGGVAGLGVVCNDAVKAEGVTGLTNPTGDAFYVDYVAHEIGHQFGGTHTFNGSTGPCKFSREEIELTAVEPGSGSSIMAYAGICGVENIATNSDPTFHAKSIAQMGAFIAGAGAACATYGVITPANSDPSSVNAGVDKSIPQNTPFRLAASAVDVGDTLSYQWDQMDAGTVATDSTTLGTDQGNNPLFRSYAPSNISTRDFPALVNQLNATTTLGETLPTMARDLNFRVTVRDGRTGQGTDDIAVTVDPASGPFKLISHGIIGETFAATDGATVTWNRANTEAPPVSCGNVDIKLYTFSADESTYGITNLLLSTPNIGTATVSIPDKANAQARFWVGCSDNIFYDLSDAKLDITGTGLFSTTDFATDPAKSTTNVFVVTGPSTTSGGGGGALDTPLLKLLLGILLTTFLSFTVRQPKIMSLLIR